MDMQILAALLGGGTLGVIGTGIFKYLTTRREQTLSNEEKLREELQDQIDALKTEVNALRTDVDHWRDKYFELYEDHVVLKARLSDD